MKEIQLTQEKMTFVDHGDFERLNQYRWYAHKYGNKYRAVRKAKNIHGKRMVLYMHREILRKDYA